MGHAGRYLNHLEYLTDRCYDILYGLPVAPAYERRTDDGARERTIEESYP